MGFILWPWHFFRWLLTDRCSTGDHRNGKYLERLRIERTAGGLGRAAAVLERALVCRDCGAEIIPYQSFSAPMDAVAFGVILTGGEWQEIESGRLLYFYPDGADTYETEEPKQ